jgi:DNA-directed RNA polymerase specialized sigma24 family protein
MADAAGLNQAYTQYRADRNENAFWTIVLGYVQSRWRDLDVASTTMLALYEAFPCYRHEGRIERWIGRVARYTRICVWRAEPDTVPFDETIPEPSCTRMIDLSAIEDPLDRMLAEAILEGLSVTEAGTRCGLKASAARMRMKRLGNKLGDRCALLL